MAEIRTGTVGEEHALTSLASSSPLASEPEPDDEGEETGDGEEGEAA